MKRRICRKDQCEEKAHNNGLCIFHYNEYHREYRRLNKEKVRSFANKSRKKRRLEDLPTRIRDAANKAVQSGILRKKNPLVRLQCKRCGDKETQAHHSSYKRVDWLNVIWLCHKHHAAWHRRNKPIYDDGIEVDKYSRWKKKPINSTLDSPTAR